MNGLFITGTDTGVGKTAVACALVAELRRRSLDVVGLKPVESGCRRDGARLIAADAEALRAASGNPAQDICHKRYELPLAPAVAAEQAGLEPPDVEQLAHWVRTRASGLAGVVVEGAGGWLVPLGHTTLVSDLGRALALPALIVCRPSLGTINHTLLTASQVARDGCEIAGFMMSETAPEAPAVRERNARDIQQAAERMELALVYWGWLSHGEASTRHLELTAAGETALARCFS